VDRKGKKNQFTNEELSKKFKNNFDLVNYAIALAENMIKSGRDTRVKSDTQNRAMLILDEISEGKDQFDEIHEMGSRPVQSAEDLQELVALEERHEKRKQRAVEEIVEE
jgi:DNA-directed RNA polymerase subunit omega